MSIGRISVVVPVYNTQEYLPHCLRSLSGQLYEDLDIILVNDGSTDASGRICDEFAQHDSRVRVIHQDNQGLSEARNTGLAHCKGAFVTFLDSDDWFDAQCLEVLAHHIQADGSDIAMCRLARVSDENEIPPSADPWVCSFERVAGLHFIDRNLSGLMAVSCGKLYKQALFSEIRFPTGRYHEDEFTTYKLLFAAERLTVINRMLYFHRTRAHSITQSPLSMVRARDAVTALMERSRFFQQHQLGELAGSSGQYMFRLYKDYSQRLRNQLSDSERKDWQRLGQDVQGMLKKLPVPIHFRFEYETFFRMQRN